MNEFKRKQWARIGLSLTAVIVATLFLAGVIGGKPMTYRIGENANAVEAAEKGFGGDVTVRLELDGGGKVKTLTVDTPDETAGLGQRASDPEFTEQFIGKAGPFTFGEDGIEALSGATVTSNAALKAINRAITGEEPAEEEKTEEKPAEEAPAAEAEYAYTAEKETNFSVIRVSANAEDGKITDCRIASEAKSAGSDFLTDEIRESWAKAIVENQTADTDAITGATLQFSAAAVKEAVAEILGQVNGGAAAEEPAEEEKTEEKPAEEAPAAEAEYAYTSEKETNFSLIRVSANAEDGKITDCRITSEAKSAGSDFLTDEIRESWAKAIVENQTADTDAITGATLQFSAAAVKEAVAEILGQVNGGAAAEEPAEEEKTEEKPAEEAPAAEESAPDEGNAGFEGQYGSYLSEKETNFSTISVYVNTREGKITKCRITSEAKSAGSDFLTDGIRESWAKAIVENQTADTDVITGATLQFSAAAVKEAVAEILGQVNGGAAAEEPAEEEKTEEKPAEETPAAEESAPDEGSAGFEGQYGSYLSEKETNFSTISVYVSTREGKITKCRITSEAKSAGSDFLTDEIRESWAKAIVENQTADTDAITGATLQFSAAAVKEAVAEILGQVNGSAAAEEPAEEEKTEDKPAEEAPAAEENAAAAGNKNLKGRYGSYLSEKETNFSTISVYVSTREGKITKCRIASEAKSAGSDFLTDGIRESWAKAIVENQTADTDAITGATLQFSAAAVKDAVSEILEKIAGR